MKARGRPAVKPPIPLTMWVFVELLRDRKGRPRLSARGGAARLAKQLPKWQAQRMTTEGVREHYKRFERTMKQSNSGDEKKEAERLLEIGRQRREIFGWDASAWIWLNDPEALAARGKNVIINDEPILPPKT